MLEVLFSKPVDGLKVAGGQGKAPDLFVGDADFNSILAGLAGGFPGMLELNPDAAAVAPQAGVQSPAVLIQAVQPTMECDTPKAPGSKSSELQIVVAPQGQVTPVLKDVLECVPGTEKIHGQQDTMVAPTGKSEDPRPDDLTGNGVQKVDVVTPGTNVGLTENVFTVNTSGEPLPVVTGSGDNTGEQVTVAKGIPAAAVQGTQEDAHLGLPAGSPGVPDGPGKSFAGIHSAPYMGQAVREAEATVRIIPPTPQTSIDGQVVETPVKTTPEVPIDGKMVETPVKTAKGIRENHEAAELLPGPRQEETPEGVLLQPGKSSSYDRVATAQTSTSSGREVPPDARPALTADQTPTPVQTAKVTVENAGAAGPFPEHQKRDMPTGVFVQPERGSTDDRGASAVSSSSPGEQLPRDGNLTLLAVKKVNGPQERAATPETFRGHQDDAAQRIQKAPKPSPGPEAMRGIEHVFQPQRSDAAQGVPFTGIERVSVEGLSRQLAEEIARRASTLTNDGRTVRIELHLDPPELGSVAVRLALSGDEVKVHFFANDVATKGLLSDALPELRSDLSQMGLNLGEAHVSVGQGHSQEPEPRSHWGTGFAVPGGHPLEAAETVPVDGINILV